MAGTSSTMSRYRASAAWRSISASRCSVTSRKKVEKPCADRRAKTRIHLRVGA